MIPGCVLVDVHKIFFVLSQNFYNKTGGFQNDFRIYPNMNTGLNISQKIGHNYCMVSSTPHMNLFWVFSAGSLNSEHFGNKLLH